MKKILFASTMVVAVAGIANAQDITAGGYVDFLAAYGEGYDLVRTDAGGDYPDDGGFNNLDFGVEARLTIDYSNETKAGLSYGAHFELDMNQSDVDTLASTGTPFLFYDRDMIYHEGTLVESIAMEKQDKFASDSISFNDGYVYLSSAFGTFKLGDTGSAGEASNQLNVPYLVGAIEADAYNGQELEQVLFANSFAGVDFEASVDDDANWAIGVGYGASVGMAEVELGLSAQDSMLAGSVGVSASGLAFGVNYAMEEAGATTEYVSAGASYTAGALTIGSGVETEIRHALGSGEEYETNYFVGASYELAQGLMVRVGVANLDSDSAENTSASIYDEGYSATYGGVSGRGFNLVEEQRAWVAGVSVKVSF